MASKLYVGGLSYQTTDDELRDAFAAHGTVESVAIIKDKFSGQSKGFGFVEMSTEDEAQAAITALNGTDFGGRTITVNPARPQEDRPRGGGSGGGGGGGGFRNRDDSRRRY
jgi:RNA recognition motif-containing protein